MSEQQNRLAQLLKCRTADSKQKNKNKHVEKYFKRPTSTNVHKYINEVKNARCEILTAKILTHISSFVFFL